MLAGYLSLGCDSAVIGQIRDIGQNALQSSFQTGSGKSLSKLRMYQTLGRPVVTYACETWVLKENIKSKLRVFERKVLRRIYGPTKESDGTLRIKSNDELK